MFCFLTVEILDVVCRFSTDSFLCIVVDDGLLPAPLLPFTLDECCPITVDDVVEDVVVAVGFLAEVVSVDFLLLMLEDLFLVSGSNLFEGVVGALLLDVVVAPDFLILSVVVGFLSRRCFPAEDKLPPRVLEFSCSY